MGQPMGSSNAITERLLTWCAEAQRAGRKCRAEVLLLLAWRAYERQPSGHAQPY
jgi:hypothetical protein